MNSQTCRNIKRRSLFQGSTRQDVLLLKMQPSGFTLLELVVVLLVMGILTSAAAPTYLTALAKFRVEATAQRIAADLEMARAHARRTSAPQNVDFNPGTNTYLLTGFADLDHRSNIYLVDLTKAGYGATLAAVNFAGGNTVTFDMYGRPDNAGTVNVSSGAIGRQINVGPTGMILVP